MERDRFRVSQAVRASISDDGLVLLDLDGGRVLASNAIGGHIWQLLEARVTPLEIARQLAASYGIDEERALHDVGAFVSALSTHGLIAEEPAS